MSGRTVAVGLAADAIKKMDAMAKELKTDDERKFYEVVRDIVSFIAIVAIDAVYGAKE